MKLSSNTSVKRWKQPIPGIANHLLKIFSIGTFGQQGQTWYVGNITYVPGSNGWLYIATEIDLYSRKIAGWAIAERMNASLENEALVMVRRGQKKEVSFIFHSDRGSQYAIREYRALLSRLDRVQSMSRKGVCWERGACPSGIMRLQNPLMEQ